MMYLPGLAISLDIDKDTGYPDEKQKNATKTIKCKKSKMNR